MGGAISSMPSPWRASSTPSASARRFRPTLRGPGTGSDPSRRGAAPDLWQPHLRGGAVQGPHRDDARDPRQVRAEALNIGIEIVDVRIVRTDLMDEVLKNTYERMSSERIAEAKDLRGRGEARKIADHGRRPTVPIPKSSPMRGASRRSSAAKAKASATRLSPRHSSRIPNSSPSTARCRPMRRAWRALARRWC